MEGKERGFIHVEMGRVTATEKLNPERYSRMWGPCHTVLVEEAHSPHTAFCRLTRRKWEK